MASYLVRYIANNLAVCYVPALLRFVPKPLAWSSSIADSVTDLRSRFHTFSLKVFLLDAPLRLNRQLTYCVSKVPCNILLKKFKRPSTYIGILVVSWGIVMTFTGVVKDFAGLVTCRIFLGIAEAGFFPGVCI
jgi:hypothetical protein